MPIQLSLPASRLQRRHEAARHALLRATGGWKVGPGAEGNLQRRRRLRYANLGSTLQVELLWDN